MCDVFPHFVLSYHPWWGQTTSGRHEMLVLPTGTGGVLYRPRFFHPIVFDARLGNMTYVGDDIAFRLSTMIKKVKVVVGCHPNQQRYLGTPPCPKIHDVVLASHGELERNTSTYHGRGGPRGGGGARSTSIVTTTAESVFGPVDAIRQGFVARSIERRARESNFNATATLPLRRVLVEVPTDLEEMEREHVTPFEAKAGGKVHQTLWGTNRQGGNDKQWKLATEYLELLGLFNMSDLIHEHIYSERASCFGLPFTQPGRVGQEVGAHTNLVAVLPFRGRSRFCALKSCKHSHKT